MFRSKPGDHQTHLSSPATDFENTAEDERWLLCLNCRAPITSRDQRISIDSEHTHTFTNPTGMAFQIGCFATAPGCLFHGEATTLYSWFAGYAWKYADCASCHHHLGWQFVNQETAHCFSGLILDRLTTSSQP
jgi:hypothetical protein